MSPVLTPVDAHPLTAMMIVAVSGVSLLVQVYSQGYMKGDSGYARYFAYMSLFTASMLGLVMARGVVQIYVFWELVGLGSYLLIGFWFQRPAAAAAAKKAFLMTRLGDFGFLLAILLLFQQDGSYLDIPKLYGAVQAGLISVSVATWIALVVVDASDGVIHAQRGELASESELITATRLFCRVDQDRQHVLQRRVLERAHRPWSPRGNR